MKILILGGNRFVGKRVLSLVVADGHSVTLVNRGSISDGMNSPLITRVHLDRNSESQMQTHFSKTDHYDVVFDFSCYLPTQAQHTRKYLDGKVGRYIFISTQSVYEDHFTSNISESAFDPYTLNLNTIPDKMDYSQGKRFTEAVFFQNSKFPVVAIRFPYILGLDDYTKRFQFHVDQINREIPIYYPMIDSQTSMIHAADAAQALMTLGFSSKFTGPLNVCSDQPISLRKMVNVIEEKTGKKALFASHHEGNNDCPYGSVTDRFMSTEKLNSLGIRVRPILEWLPELIR